MTSCFSGGTKLGSQLRRIMEPKVALRNLFVTIVISCGTSY